MTNTVAAVEAADEFTDVLADSPCRLFAAVTRDGSVWEYRSVLVRDEDDLRRPVRERLERDGYSLTEQREYVDPGMMFGRAVERVYRRPEGHLDSAEAHDRSCSCGDFAGHVAEESAAVTAD